MNPSTFEKLEGLGERLEELSSLLADASVIADQERFRNFSKEHAELTPVVNCFQQYNEVLTNIASTRELLADADLGMKMLAQEELVQAEQRKQNLEQELEMLLIPKDPADNSNIFVEIRAGTGGDEAALFAGDLFRMYCRYAELRGWKIEPMSENRGEHGGYKEIICGQQPLTSTPTRREAAVLDTHFICASYLKES